MSIAALTFFDYRGYPNYWCLNSVAACLAGIETDMKCRICDRKDEAVNVVLNRLALAYQRIC